MSLLSKIASVATTCLSSAVVGGACLACVFLVNLYRKQDSLLYHPVIPGLPKRCDENPPPFHSPAAWGLRHEELEITTADGERIHGWFVHAEGNGTHAPTIVFFHANAGEGGVGGLCNQGTLCGKCAALLLGGGGAAPSLPLAPPLPLPLAQPPLVPLVHVHELGQQ